MYPSKNSSLSMNNIAKYTVAPLTTIIPVFIRKEISVAKVVSSAWKYLLAGAMMLVVLVLENQKWESSILNTGIMVVSGATVYFAMLFILRDEFLLGYIKKVLRK